MDPASMRCPAMDLHVCGTCHREYTDLQEFIEHKKYSCLPTPIIESSLLDQTSPRCTTAHDDILTNQLLQAEGDLLKSPDIADGQSTVVQIHTSDGVHLLGSISLQTLQLLQQQQQLQQLIQGHDHAIQALLQSQSDVLQPGTTQDPSAAYSATNPGLKSNSPEDGGRNPGLNSNCPEDGGISDSMTADQSIISELLKNLPNQNVQVIQSSMSNMQLDQQGKEFDPPGIQDSLQIHSLHGNIPASPDIKNTISMSEAIISKTDNESPHLSGPSHGNSSNESVRRPLFRPPEKPLYRFKCTVADCNYITQYPKNVERHMHIHTGERPYACGLCDQRFTRSDKLKNHHRTHTGEKPYKCTECEYSCRDNSSLKKHLRIHTDERPYKCQICSYASRNSSQLTVHLRTHTGDKPFMCPECNATFKIKSDLKRHRRMHTGEKPYACQQCSFKTAVNGNLKTHMKIYHCEENMVRCPLCDYKTSSSRILSAHKKTHMLLEERQSCDACDYTCFTDRQLRKHALTHRTDKPFSCCFCQFSTKTRANLGSHMRNKHIEKHLAKGARKKKYIDDAQGKGILRQTFIPAKCFEKYACELCGAKFVRADSLNAHMRSHEEIKAYEAERNTVAMEQLADVCATMTSEPQNTKEVAENHDSYQITQEHEYAAVKHDQLKYECSETHTESTVNDTATVVVTESCETVNDKMAEYHALQNLLPFIQNNHNTAVWENMQNMAAMNSFNHRYQARTQSQHSQSRGTQNRQHNACVNDNLNQGSADIIPFHGEQVEVQSSDEVELRGSNNGHLNMTVSSAFACSSTTESTYVESSANNMEAVDVVSQANSSPPLLHSSTNITCDNTNASTQDSIETTSDSDVVMFTFTDSNQEQRSPSPQSRCLSSVTIAGLEENSSLNMLSAVSISKGQTTVNSSDLPADVREIIKTLNLPKGTVITIPYDNHQIRVITNSSDTWKPDLADSSDSRKPDLDSKLENGE